MCGCDPKSLVAGDNLAALGRDAEHPDHAGRSRGQQRSVDRGSERGAEGNRAGELKRYTYAAASIAAAETIKITATSTTAHM